MCTSENTSVPFVVHKVYRCDRGRQIARSVLFEGFSQSKWQLQLPLGLHFNDASPQHGSQLYRAGGGCSPGAALATDGPQSVRRTTDSAAPPPANLVHLTWTPSLSHGLAVFGQLWRHSDLGLLAIVVVALGEHLPSRWSLKGVATAAASCILLISFWVFLHAANSYVAGVVFAGSAIFLIDCWARVHVPHAVLACVLQGLFYRFFSTTLPQTSTSGAVASGPWLEMALALLAASGASIFVLLFAHDAADTEATPNSGPGAERSSKKKKTWLKRTDKEHWKLQDASYSVPYTGFAPAIGSGHFTSKDVDRVMSTFGHASMALLLFLSGGSSAPIQTVHVFSNNVRFRSVSVALLLYSCAAAVVYHVVAVVFLLCNAGLQFVLWLLGPLWRLLRSVLVFFEPGAKANVWCAYVRKNGSCEETVLDCGDTKAHRTAHIKVLVNDVWIQLRLLSVVHVKDVLKGLEKHFGIPSVFCTLKYQGRTLTRKECIPTDPATPLELCFKSPQGLDSTKPLQKLQSNATAQIQQMVDGLAGIESKHSEADRGLADTDKLILLGRVDERLLRELRKLEHQSTAHKTGVAMESTSLIEILMDEGWRNEHCTMQVFVEVGGRRHGTITLNVRPSDDVTMLQRRICDTVGVPLEQQRLTYGTKELQAGQTLADYGIEKESTIRLGGRLLGGGNCCRKCVGGGIVQVAAGPDEAGAGPSPASAPAQTSSEGNVARRDQEPASKEERVEAVVQVAAGADEAGAGPSPASAPAQTSSEGNVARRIQEPASKKEREPVLVEAIVQGQWDAQLVKALQAHKVPKIIRVFLSSTFTDTAEERNHILKVVVPKLQELFGRHGYEFQASEMRWSIREGESNDMQTSAICMIELSNCQASAGLTYVYIECDKYGFRPPPKTIPQDVFRMLVVEMPDDDRVFIEECYKLDTNSVHTPPEFKTHMPTCGPTGQVREAWDSQDGPQFVLQIGTSDPVKPKDKAAQAVAWARFMSLCTTLRAAAWKVWHQENPRDKKSHHFLKKFIISVTEEELCHGALWANPEPGRTRIKIFKRSFKEQEGTFKGIPLHDPTAKAFVDMDNMQVDKEAQKLLDEQKAMVEPDHAWSILWAEGKGVDPTKEEHKQYLDEFCARFEEACIDSLNEALANEIESDSVVDEPERHLRFAAERAGKYHPTPTAVTVVDNVMTFLGNGRDGKVFVVHGKSGAGKTYIMSEVTRRAAVKAKDIGGVCVARFLGTTAASSKVSLLLEAIILQIARAYGKGTDLEIPSDFRKLQALFVEAVKTWPSEAKPMTLILDSVDQLDDTNGGRRLQWLPASDLPSCVRIIVSSLPDYPTIDEKQGFKCLSLLQGALKDEGCFSKVADIEDPREVVEHLLRLQGRALTEQQMQAVLGAFERRSANDMAGTPLWLTLVAHKAAKWHSYTLPPVIPSSVRELIVELFQDLAKQRGAKLVRKVLACLTLCKDGISEVELAHVLSLDDEVLAEAYEWWAPPVRVIPCICITRILADLEPFLANRGNGGAKGWYHRQFWEAAEAWLFKSEGSELREGVHAELADYFSGKHHGVPKRYSQELQVVVQKHFPGETAGDRLVPAQATMLSGDVLDADSTGQMRLNERRLTEYVHHSARAGWQTETLAELASPLYMTLKFMAAMGTDLQLELVDAMQRFPQAAQALQRVKAFVGKNIEICRRPEVPSAILQAAHNEPDASPVRKSLLAVKDFAKHSIQWINRSQLFDPCQLLLSATSEVMAVAYASDGKRVAYGCSDGTIQVVSALTGDILSSLTGHTGWVFSVAFSPNGQMLASGSSDATVRVWDPSTGEEKRSLTGHTEAVTSVAFSPNGQMLASGSTDKTVRVWDPLTGEEKRSLRGRMFCWCPGHIATAEGTACRVYRMDGRLVSYVIAPSTVNSVTCSGKLVTAGCVSGEVMHLQVDFLVD